MGIPFTRRLVWVRARLLSGMTPMPVGQVPPTIPLLSSGITLPLVGPQLQTLLEPNTPLPVRGWKICMTRMISLKSNATGRQKLGLLQASKNRLELCILEAHRKARSRRHHCPFCWQDFRGLFRGTILPSLLWTKALKNPMSTLKMTFSIAQAAPHRRHPQAQPMVSRLGRVHRTRMVPVSRQAILKADRRLGECQAELRQGRPQPQAIEVLNP